ncbi:signal peptidase II [Maritalea myrionectae]|uniref:Lipoprotein signal peptidase n=1 Tax=Maritalea myrionectae TaxID=454601 RepID=A0A2R4MHF6_9HYPH|nr:signal peptidase II [Maritalea myrionectae]AVX05309.1 signal peptidase II [Maritalea myrionectae]
MKANIAHKSLFAFFLALLLDQVHKIYMLNIVGWTGGEIVTVTPFFDYVLAWNTGISYGWLGDASPYVLVGIMGIAMLGLAIWWVTATTELVKWGIATVLGGALGNLIDRIAYGAVADFFSFHAFGYYWYIFNLADVAIALGLIILLWDIVLKPQGDSSSK